ncbi:hypothetical protein BBJ29_003155 [Phytophthora kernoviae]|uniref:Nucleotide-diphospho-sugar transferase domain-containing protein n=1 Tax=Phytophthora kernoviae TaxID=325452 RepID=A0A3F2RPZ1_9STRA|nr:hypothetical protein BBJ29_003155 [Phytophthora kernoviae]RLN61909.1 hypothetical protein BBP00_00005110 [Phytophthora kernoviae]
MQRHCSSLQRSARVRCDDALAFVEFRVEARKVIEKALVPGFKLPNVVTDQASPRDGIVIVVYPKMVASAYAMVRVLREEFNCNLPIELCFHKIKDPRAMGFGAKVFSIYHSSLDRVLFLDADNVPVGDPSFLFKSTEFEDTGAIFWPDFWHPIRTIFNIHATSMLWELLDMPFVDMFEQESGQLLIDRRRHAAPLKLAFFYMFRRPNHFEKLKVAHGDKDLFRFAWLKLEAPFYMIQTPPAVAGKVINETFCGMTMVQHDVEGQVLFFHRNQFKLTGRIPGIKKREAPEADGLPDPVIWTHLLSFSNTSAVENYIIDAYSAEPEFPKGQNCYGKREIGKNPHFATQGINNMSFAGLETTLRRFALEAAQVQKQEYKTHGGGK